MRNQSCFNACAREILRCSFCGGELDEEIECLHCRKCDCRYRRTAGGALDLRLKRPKEVTLRCTLGVDLPLDGVDLSPLAELKDSAASKLFGGPQWHLSRELLSHLPKATTPGSLVLDLGCGRGFHREACEKLGYAWVGLDYHEASAPILGDAHALPFADESFDLILSIAVLEHLRNPLVAMQECFRVLKRGRTFIGTVAFLEPFHGNSYYHHTHLGTLSSLTSGGFKVDTIAPSTEWTVLKAQADMAFFPRMPAWLRTALITPLETAYKAWWAIGNRLGKVKDPAVRIRQSTGAFAFIARK